MNSFTIPACPPTLAAVAKLPLVFAANCDTKSVEVLIPMAAKTALETPVGADDFMPKEKPVHEVRLGAIKAAIWRNDTEKGVRYNTTFSRLYKDGDEWKNTDSFGRDDLLVLAKVADQAHSWIHEQNQEEEKPDDKRAAKR